MSKEYVSFTGQRYRVVRRIAYGGMGGAFLATNVATGQLVKLELIPESLAPLEQVVRDVMRQFSVAVLDEGKATEGYFRVMEYVQGKTLAQITFERGTPPADEALKIVRQIATTLAEVHERGVVHRDIKPSNIMITDKGEPKLIDFGIAALAGEAPEIRAVTPGYAPPEQYAEAVVDKRSDIYALGMTLYELLTGMQPPPPAPELLTGASALDLSQVPEPIRPIIRKATTFMPAERFQSARELATAISQLLEKPPMNTAQLAVKEFLQDFVWTIIAVIAITLIGTLVYASQVSLLGVETSGIVLGSMLVVASIFTLVRQRGKAHQL